MGVSADHVAYGIALMLPITAIAYILVSLFGKDVD